MAIISGNDYKKLLKSGIGTGYLFYGEEDYLKAYALRETEKEICPDSAFSVFNVIKIDALDYSPQKLLDALMPPPMMTERKLIILTCFDFRSVKQDELDALFEVLAELSTYDYNTVIFTVSSGSIDEGYSSSKPSGILLKLEKYLTPVCFEKSTPQKLALWAIKHFEHGGAKISEKNAAFLVEYCGTGMYKLSNEIDKLCAYVAYHGRSEVTAEDIRQVSIADTEFDTFALTNAIMEGRSSDALSVLDFLKFKRTDPLIIFGEISKTICDLLMVKRLTDDGMTPFDIGKAKIINEYRAKILAANAKKISYERLRRKIAFCTEADRQLKLSPKGYSAIELLISAE